MQKQAKESFHAQSGTVYKSVTNIFMERVRSLS